MKADDPRHGTLAGHAAGCRERCCGEAKLAYDKRRRFYGPRTVDATGTLRRIRALQALGWSMPTIAKSAGLSERTIANPTFRGTGIIYVTTADAVRRAYEQLSMTLPQGGYANRSRKAARRKGWLPPLAYDEGQIDNPDYKPLSCTRKTQGGHFHKEAPFEDIDEAVILRVLAGENLPTNKAERAEILRRWIAGGGSERELCRRMGWKPGRYGSRIVDGAGQPDRTERKAS